MRLIENRKGVVRFFLYNTEQVLLYDDKIVIGNRVLPVNPSENYNLENGVFFQMKNKGVCEYDLFRYDGSSFTEDSFRYETKKYFNSEQYCSFESEELDDENVEVKISFVDKGNEIQFKILSEMEYDVWGYDKKNEVLLLNSSYPCDSLLFYTKTGERLWEYQVEEGLEIYEDAIIVVDDIVVITCTKNTRNYSVEGFKLSTGEKVWEIYDVEHCRKKYVQGSDKMLYSLMSFHSKDHTLDLRLTKLNPFTGDVEMTVLKEGNYWTHIWPWNTTIHGNKLFYTNLITEQGCSIGVVDLDKKELIEDFPMESQGNQIEKPIVTDDKIYVRVRDLNELRIYENEYK